MQRRSTAEAMKGTTARRRPAVAPSTPLAGLLLALAVCVVLVWAAPAQAGVVHVFGGYFGSQGSGPGQLKEPRGVAVNDTTHDVYVVDRGNNRVQEFNSTGTAVLADFNGSAAPTGPFVGPSWIAVDNSQNPLDPSAGDVYVVDEGHKVIDKFTAEGTYVGQLTGTPSGAFITETSVGLNVAVDPRGVLWVLQSATGEVDSFSDAAANEYQSRRTVGSGYEQGFAVDGKDNIYGAGEQYTNGQYRSVIEKWSSSGEVLVENIDDEEAAGGGPRGATVDPVGEELYTDDLSNTIGAFTLGGVRLERFGAGHLTSYCCNRGIAVDASNATVYAADAAGGRVAIFDGVRLPTVTLGVLSEQQPESVTLNGAVNPEGTLVSSCVFEYDTRPYESESEAPHGESAPCTPSPGSGNSAVAVSAHINGLSAEKAYYFRLVASSGFGTSRTPGQEFFTGPRLAGEFVSDVSSSSVTLQARVDPNGADTQYYFEFGASASYGLDVPVAPPGVDIGSASGMRSLSVHLQGLQPGSEYHYRLVVTQAGKVFEGADHLFTTQPLLGGEPGLLDGRAWELVSPADKGGALIEPFESMPLQAAADGNGVTYSSFGPVGENVAGRTVRAQILSMRTPAGWRTQDIDPPHALAATNEVSGEGFEYRLFSPNLSFAVIEQRANVKVVLSPQAAAQGNPLYSRDNNQGTYQPLLTAGDVQPESGRESQVEFDAATPDLAHVILESPLALTPEAPENWFPKDEHAGAANLYESSATAGLQLVNLLPDGRPETDAGHGAYLAGEGSGHFESALRAVSSDGRWVAWTAGQPYTGTNGVFKGLYVRDMVEGQTLKVGGAAAFYQTMSSDGSLVFFIEGGELYVLETATGIQTDLTAGHGPGATSALVREALLGMSEDGSYVYFVAGGVLAGSSGAVSGQDNVYVMHDAGGVWSTRYITTLSSEDERDWYVKGPFGGVQLESVRSRVSPDGRFLTFMSDRSLTGYDNLDASSGKPDEEVYLYHAPADPGAEAGGLFCASCNPTGARPDGALDTGLNVPLDTFSAGGNWTDRWLAGIVPGWNSALFGKTGYQPRYLSNSGRLFFESPDGLVPRATNGRWDVYEFEPAGVGACTAVTVGYSSRSGGCVGLISGGTSSADSTFLDASENGEDVFFTTSSRLVGRDYDTAPDVYDAHVCSSASPCLQEPVLAAPCSEGEACKGAPPAQPLLFGAPPSATFNGQGNVIPSSAPVVKKKTVKCSKGKKLSRGKCIKAKAKHKTKAHRAKKATAGRGAGR
jgi:DNA-binding beta-propeller fold protein YncE